MNNGNKIKYLYFPISQEMGIEWKKNLTRFLDSH
jgi:hypothetical protein